jgi:hypothetical protein
MAKNYRCCFGDIYLAYFSYGPGGKPVLVANTCPKS